MSRVGKAPIDFSKNVSVEINGSNVHIKGPKGELVHELPSCIDVTIQDNQLLVAANDQDNLKAKALRGLTRALLANNVKGVEHGYSESLLLVGVGYRVQASKTQDGLSRVDLTLGLSHPIHYVAPQGIALECPSATEIVVTGICKRAVGQAAADIRNIGKGIRKPEPYKGKGIRYKNEVIRLKETKKKK